MRSQRLKRSKTGCQDCRRRRVRCPEGQYLPGGGREECLMCKRGRTQCFYPIERPGERKPIWVAAKDYHLRSPSRHEFQPSSVGSEADQTVSCSTNSPINDLNAWIDSLPCDLNVDLSAFTVDFRSPDCEIESIVNHAESSQNNDDDEGEWQLEQFDSTVNALLTIGATNQVPLWQRRAIRNLFASSHSIQPPLSEPGITQMTDDQLDVFAVRTFENDGCKEIVSVGHQNQNWIHSLLLPKITHLFTSSGTQERSSTCNPSIALKRYGFHALMQLSYVHQSNTQKDKKLAIEAGSRALKHRSLASTTAFQLRVRHPASSWQVEEYFMSFFITCMADMLSSHTFQVEDELIFGLPDTSTFSKSLKGLLGVYRNLSEICKPSDPVSTAKIELETISFDVFEEKDSDPWVENFFGFSTSIIECFRNVNKLVSYRIQLLRSTEQEIKEGEERLKIILKELVGNLEHTDGWRACSWVKGLECKPRRVQRGTMVVSRAITMIIYSELLQADLQENQQLQQLRQSAVELVADTCIQELAGYHLMLAIIAIYTPDVNQRHTYLEMLTMAQSHSFGHGHKGLGDVVHQCWKMYDEAGKYMDGIAPWREMMAASGVSMCI